MGEIKSPVVNTRLLCMILKFAISNQLTERPEYIRLLIRRCRFRGRRLDLWRWILRDASRDFLAVDWNVWRQ